MTTTRFFQSSDTSAPVVSGQAGALIAVLKAVLVGDGSGVAYGTGANEKRSAGWTLEYDDTGAKKCVFRNSLAAGGSGCYLRVDDSNATYALVRTYRTMSDVDTGSDPTDQYYWNKSSASSSAARAWIIVADEQTVYYNVCWNNSAFGISYFPVLCGAGDIESLIPGDAYRYICFGKATASISGTNTEGIHCASNIVMSGTTYASNATLGGSAAQSAVSTALRIAAAPGGAANQEIGFNNVMSNPAPNTSDIFASRAIVLSDSAVRGYMRGLYAPLVTVAGLAGSVTVSGSRKLCVVNNSFNSTASRQGGFFVETAKSWS